MISTAPAPFAPAVAPFLGPGNAAPPEIHQNGYMPQPGDSIDARLAGFVNEPQNAHCKALFCRLSEGSYLYGTHRTQLRIAPQTDQLEAFEENTWIPIHEFTRYMEGSQGVHLQRTQPEVLTLA